MKLLHYIRVEYLGSRHQPTVERTGKYGMIGEDYLSRTSTPCGIFHYGRRAKPYTHCPDAGTMGKWLPPEDDTDIERRR